MTLQTPLAPADAGAVEARALLAEIDALAAAVRGEAETALARWGPPGAAADDAANLACYLAMRSRDLRGLQRRLAALGVSSLTHMESAVLPTLDAVAATLAALAGAPPRARPDADAYYGGAESLERRADDILGFVDRPRWTKLLVTCPSEAAEAPDFIQGLALRGVEALRINCAHDDADAWARMIAHARAAEAMAGRPFRIFMDLAGPKIRTAAVKPRGNKRLNAGDAFAILREGAIEAGAGPDKLALIECTLPEALTQAGVGQSIWIDDGKLGARVESVETWGLLARVTQAEEKGWKLKPEKGLNFPDAEFDIPALTDKDLDDLAFVATHADGVALSFVESARDVRLLQEALGAIRPRDWTGLTLILKIETPRAVRNLPAIIVAAASRQPAVVMIARGDLAVEIGFARLAEMQEEILWLCEAARTPAIWATQVLEHLVKKGSPSRGEMTDAAMAARAECVMLNKGPHLFEAVDVLNTLLDRMGDHQRKKHPQLRRLTSW